MVVLTRNRRPFPVRALAILVAMLAIAGASQLLTAGRVAPGAVKPLAIGADPAQPAVGDLDPGPVSAAGSNGGIPAGGTTAELDRIKANIAFWSARVERQEDDFVSSNGWGVSEIELARATGDLTAYLRAGAAFDLTLAHDPTNAAGLGYKGSVLVSLHRFSDAVALAASVLVRVPDDPVALATLGDGSLELGDVATARTAYTRVDALDRSGATLARLAHLAFIVGDGTTARNFAAAAVEAADAEGSVGERAAWYRYQLGEILAGTGDLTGAGRAYAAALEFDPGSFLAHSGVARVAAANGDLDLAITELSAAIAIIPQPDFLARRSDLYTLRGAPGDARRASGDAATIEVVAKLAAAAGNVYDRSLSLYLANHNLEPERAVQLARSELGVRKDVYGYDTLAWALLAAGRPAEAEAAMTAALAFGTHDAKLLYHAGMIEAELGKISAARAWLTEALALDPSFDPLQVVRARETLANLP